MNPVYIYDALRTPLAKSGQGGAYYELRPVDLLRQCLLTIAERNPIGLPAQDLILGCTTPLGDMGQNIARAGLLHAGQLYTSGIQINRFDLSGLDAIGLAAAKIAAGFQQRIIAGGMELQSRLEPGQDRGPWTDDPDLAILPANVPAVFSADLQAHLWEISASELFEYAEASRRRCRENVSSGVSFLKHLYDENKLVLLAEDQLSGAADFFAEGETPLLTREVYQCYLPLIQKHFTSLEHFPPVHSGFTTASEVDGMAMLMLGDASAGEEGTALARILAYSLEESTTGLPFSGMPAVAKKALQQASLTKEDIDLWTCDEPFAGIALAFQKEMTLPPEKINAGGGNLAFGRPAGANGALLLVRLLEDLKNKGAGRGMLVLGDRSGSCAAMIIENL